MNTLRIQRLSTPFYNPWPRGEWGGDGIRGGVEGRGRWEEKRVKESPSKSSGGLPTV